MSRCSSGCSSSTTRYRWRCCRAATRSARCARSASAAAACARCFSPKRRRSPAPAPRSGIVVGRILADGAVALTVDRGIGHLHRHGRGAAGARLATGARWPLPPPCRCRCSPPSSRRRRPPRSRRPPRCAAPTGIDRAVATAPLSALGCRLLLLALAGMAGDARAVERACRSSATRRPSPSCSACRCSSRAILSQWSAAIVRPARRLLRVEDWLAVTNLSAAVPRLSISVAALAVSLSMMVAIAIMIGSFRQTVVYWVGQTLQADLFISPGSRPAARHRRARCRPMSSAWSPAARMSRPSIASGSSKCPTATAASASAAVSSRCC